MNGAIKDFIDALSKEVEENNAAIFAGAGLSVPAGFVDWKSLIEPLAKEIGLDVRREENHDFRKPARVAAASRTQFVSPV